MSIVAVNGFHHVALVVTDLPRANAFYQEVLGFKQLVDMGTRTINLCGNAVVALTLPAGPGEVPSGDRFDENRVGLDHLSFAVASHDDLVKAVEGFDAKGVTHGEIRDLGEGMRIYVLAFRDPDNIQLELTAPYA